MLEVETDTLKQIKASTKEHNCSSPSIKGCSVSAADRSHVCVLAAIRPFDLVQASLLLLQFKAWHSPQSLKPPIDKASDASAIESLGPLIFKISDTLPCTLH